MLNQKSFHSLPIVLFSVAVGIAWPAFGEAASSVHPVTVLFEKSGQLAAAEISSDKLAQGSIEVLSNTPHRHMNPDHLVSRFRGVALQKLLSPYGLTHAQEISVVGADGYSSLIPVLVAESPSTILAFEENGASIPKQRGEQQLIFPTEGAPGAAVPGSFTKKAAFWTWYVRGFALGQLPNALLDLTRGQSRPMSGPGTPVRYVPPSVFSYDKHTCPDAVAIPILDSLRKGLNGKAKLTVHFKSLTSKVVPVDSHEWFIVSRSGEAIPVRCGGPFLVLKTSGQLIPGRIYRDDEYIPYIYGFVEDTAK